MAYNIYTVNERSKNMAKKKWLIGCSDNGFEYLEDFSWDCSWYWGGGYLGNKHLHHHVDGIRNGENINMFDAMKKYFHKSLELTDNQLWRFCDLFTQFYAYKKAAECFQHGGHYTSEGRTEQEINKEMGAAINAHLASVIIPEIRKLMDEVATNTRRTS